MVDNFPDIHKLDMDNHLDKQTDRDSYWSLIRTLYYRSKYSQSRFHYIVLGNSVDFCLLLLYTDRHLPDFRLYSHFELNFPSRLEKAETF